MGRGKTLDIGLSIPPLTHHLLLPPCKATECTPGGDVDPQPLLTLTNFLTPTLSLTGLFCEILQNPTLIQVQKPEKTLISPSETPPPKKKRGRPRKLNKSCLMLVFSYKIRFPKCIGTPIGTTVFRFFRWY